MVGGSSPSGPIFKNLRWPVTTASFWLLLILLFSASLSSFSLSNEEGSLPFTFHDMDELLKYGDSEKLIYTDGDILLTECTDT